MTFCQAWWTNLIGITADIFHILFVLHPVHLVILIVIIVDCFVNQWCVYVMFTSQRLKKKIQNATFAIEQSILKVMCVIFLCKILQNRQILANESLTWGLIYKTLLRFHPKCVGRHKSYILHVFIKPCECQNLPKNAFINPGQGKIVHTCISTPKSPYMELTAPSLTMHNLLCISFPCIFPSTWLHV